MIIVTVVENMVFGTMQRNVGNFLAATEYLGFAFERVRFFLVGPDSGD